MMNIIKNVLGIGTQANFQDLVANGAVIVDVRNPDEFSGGNIKGSINIPLGQLDSRLSSLEKDKAIITCCASGVRSGMAQGKLKAKGFTNVYNGGGWHELQRKLSH